VGTRFWRRRAWIDSLSSEELRTYEQGIIRRHVLRGETRPGGNRLYLWERRWGPHAKPLCYKTDSPPAIHGKTYREINFWVDVFHRE
jgi:hypothetical protein